jgi:CzcA family heavy metal efflux pump
MIDRIIQLSLHRRALVLTVALALFVYGLVVGRTIPIDVFPDLNRPLVTVLTEVHGLGAEEIETQITAPLELSINGAPGVARVRSASSQGISIIWAEFDWSTEIFNARQVVTERLQQARPLLPADVTPALGPISSIMGEIMLIGVTGDGVTPTEVRTFAETVVRPRLLAIPGISLVSVIGGERQQYEVAPSLPMLYAQGLTLDDIVVAVREANGAAAGGVIPSGYRDVPVRGVGRLQGRGDLDALVIFKEHGGGRQSIPLRQIATIAERGDPARRGDAGVNGVPGVILSIQKQPQGDTIALTKAVERELQLLQGSLPAGIKIKSDLFRQAEFIERSVANVIHALVVGALLIAVVLILFLMNARTTIITLVTIPLSLGLTVIVFHWLGLSINTMTLGGLAIAIGELVDDAIVDVENVFRRLKENAAQTEPRPILLVVFEASREIRNSIVIATAIVITVFIPLFFLSGIEGRIFQPLGAAYVIAILASLLVAVTVTPVLCAYLLKPERARGLETDSRLVIVLKAAHLRLLGHVRGRYSLWVGGTVLGFIGALLLSSQAGREFLPPFNEGSLTINVALPPEASLGEASQLGSKVEQALLAVPEVVSTGRRTGRAELDEHAQGVNSSEIEVELRRSERSQREVLADIRSTLGRFPGAEVDVGQPISHRIDHILSGVEAQIVVKIFGPDLNALRTLGRSVVEIGRGVEGLVDLRVEPQVLVSQLEIKPQREVIATLGISTRDIVATVDHAVGGDPATEIVSGARRIPVVVRLPEVYDSFGAEIKGVPVRTGQGTLVPLERVATFESVQAPNLIGRENGSRKLGVYANVAGRDLGSVVQEWQKRLAAELTLPPGYLIRFEGQYESQGAATRVLWILGLLAILVVGVILLSHYKNLRYVGQILMSVPFAAIGALLGVYLTTNVFSIASLVGLITVTGIATRNGVMMIDHIVHLTEVEGAPRNWETLCRAAQERLVPVLMTALTAMLALVPILAAPHEPGRELLYPVAVVIFGGLCTGTILNLALTPVLFGALSGWSRRS